MTPTRSKSQRGSNANSPFSTQQLTLTKTSSMPPVWVCTPRPFWRESALCSGMSVDLFFGGGDGLPQSMRQIEMSKAVCRKCPVQRDCLIFALQRHEPFGVWGGMARHERLRAMSQHHDDIEAVVRDYEANELLRTLGDHHGQENESHSGEGLRTAAG